MSVWTRPMVAAKRAVSPPTHATISRESGAISKSLWQRATMYTPAVTMVAAWMRAETGVGPSMASGSQVWSRNCADLPMAPMNRSRQIRVRASACQPRKLMVLPVSAGADHHEHGEDAEREAEIADPVDDEGLDGGRVRLRLVVPEADEQIAHQP